jgi:hypothetical protein
MSGRNLFLFSRYMGSPALLCVLSLLLIFPAGGRADSGQTQTTHFDNLPFRPGEQLTYNISWSNVISAGTATLEVQRDRSPEGRDELRFISTAHSIGIVDSFYRVNDRIESVVDARTLRPLLYTMKQHHGKRKKERELVFDQSRLQVTYHKDGLEEVVPVPEGVQDALSSMYFLRSQQTFTTADPIVIKVIDSGKTWSVEVHVLGREHITVPAGEFDTIKVRTYPKYEGVFMHKGEIFIWLTDDARKIPVLMKSTITIGSIMASLTVMKLGDKEP